MITLNGLTIKSLRGLVIDKEKGKLVKAYSFGYIKWAMHRTRMLSTREVRYGLGFCVCLSAQNIDPYNRTSSKDRPQNVALQIGK